MLPAISLGFWHNFGGIDPLERSRAIVTVPSTSASRISISPTTTARRYGSAEENFGRLMRDDFRPYRDELIISTKAGYDMWPGPYGEWGSRKYLLASLDQSLKRMGLDYVDIFYSHRFDPGTPLEETMGALTQPCARARPSMSGSRPTLPSRRARPRRSCARSARRCLIHQPSYSILNRWIEHDLLDVLGRARDRLHRVLAARAGSADRPLSERDPRRIAREP